MRRYLWLLALLPSLCHAVGEQKQFPLTDFHCGLDSYHSPLNLPNCYVQDALNVYFDQQTYATKRQGYTVAFSSKSYQITGLWSYTDSSNNIWMVARASDTIMATTGIGTSQFNIKIATVAAANVVNAVVAFGNIYFVDQTQGVYYWNGTATTYVGSTSPHGSLIAEFHGRLWVAGIAVPNGNQLYGSKYLDGTTWTTGSLSTDAVQFTVGLQDNFDNIAAFFSGYNDVLYIFKNYSIHGLYGFDQTDFQIRVLNKEVGCIDQRSMQPFQGGLVFASPRGLEFFDGYTATRISDPIKNKVDPITLNSSFNQNSWVQQNQADWSAGTISLNGSSVSLSTTAAVPTLVLSTFSAFAGTDNSAANWNAGSLVNLDSTTNAPNLQLSSSLGPEAIDQKSEDVTNGGVGTFLNDTAQSFTTSSSNPQQITSIAINCWQSGTAPSTTISIKSDSSNSPGTTLVSATINGSSCGTTFGNNATAAWNKVSLTPTSLSPSTKYWVFLTHAGSSGNQIRWMTGGNTYSGGNLWDSTNGNFPTLDGTFREYVQINNGYSTTGSITSRVFDVGFTTNTRLWNWGAFNTTETDNGQTITYQTQVATSSTGAWDSAVSVTPGATIASATKEFIRYIASFSGSGVATPVLSTVTVNTSVMTVSTGAFKSQIHGLGSISSFGNFAVSQDLTAGGVIAYSICSSTNSNMSTPVRCGDQTVNAAISIATGTFVQVYATFTVTMATQAPVLQSFTVNWFTGSSKPPMASAVYDNRYWLSVTTNTSDSVNDSTLILSKGPIWSVFSTQAGAFVIWKNALYHADANATGNVYQDNQGYQDNATPITAYIWTKDYAPETWIADKYFKTLYMTVDNQGSYNVSTSYFIDGSTVAYSLSTAAEDEQVGRNYAKLPFPIGPSNQNFGKSISFKFQNADANAPMQLYGGLLLYKSRMPL